MFRRTAALHLAHHTWPPGGSRGGRDTGRGYQNNKLLLALLPRCSMFCSAASCQCQSSVCHTSPAAAPTPAGAGHRDVRISAWLPDLLSQPRRTVRMRSAPRAPAPGDVAKWSCCRYCVDIVDTVDIWYSLVTNWRLDTLIHPPSTSQICRHCEHYRTSTGISHRHVLFTLDIYLQHRKT